MFEQNAENNGPLSLMPNKLNMKVVKSLDIQE